MTCNQHFRTGFTLQTMVTRLFHHAESIQLVEKLVDKLASGPREIVCALRVCCESTASEFIASLLRVRCECVAIVLRVCCECVVSVL